MMCPAPYVVKVYGCCPILTTRRDSASASLRDQEGQRGCWDGGKHHQVVGPIERGSLGQRLQVPWYKRPCWHVQPCSFMGIWTETVFAGKSEEAAIGLVTGGPDASGKVVRGEVQGVGRGVPSGKAAAGPAAVPRAKQGTWCWWPVLVACSSGLCCPLCLQQHLPGVKWDRMGQDGTGSLPRLLRHARETMARQFFQEAV